MPVNNLGDKLTGDQRQTQKKSRDKLRDESKDKLKQINRHTDRPKRYTETI